MNVTFAANVNETIRRDREGDAAQLCLERRNRHTLKMQVLRLFYYLSGGIYATHRVKRANKILWMSASAAMLTLIILVGALGYLITAKRVDVLSVYALLWSVDCALNVFIIVPVITYRYRREFETLLDFIEKNAVDDTGPPDICVTGPFNRKSAHWLSELSYIMIIELVTTVVFAAIGPIDVIFLCDDENAFRDLHHHLIGFPFMYLLSSKRLALLIYAVELILWISGITMALSHVNLLVIIATELNNVVIEYCRQINHLGTYINENTPPSTFQRNLISLVKRHQHLVKMTKMITPFIETFNTLTRIFIVAGLLCVIYVILLTDLEIILKLKQVALTAAFLIYFYPQCEFCSQITAMNESIQHYVYDLPWYRLPPKERTMLFIFLGQVQRPVEFKAFSIYSVDRHTFPNVLQKTYSLLNVLRPTINTGHLSSTN